MQTISQTFSQLIGKNARWGEFAESNGSELDASGLSVSPLTKDEQIITACITYTFVFYLLGALYLIAPILGWLMLTMIVCRWSVAKPFENQNSQWLIK